MKKFSLILAALLSVAVLLTSCGTVIPEINLNHKFPDDTTVDIVDTDDGDDTNGKNPSSPSDSEGEESDTLPATPLENTQLVALCASLSAMSAVRYDEIGMQIATETSSGILNSTYTVTGSQVQYSVERFNRFTIEGGTIVPPVSYKTVYTGSAVIVNDRVISVDGDVVELPSYQTLVGGFVFDPSNFSDATQSGNGVTLTVVDASAFWGSSLTAENMTVTIGFDADRFVSIIVAYQTETANVTVNYDFQ